MTPRELLTAFFEAMNRRDIDAALGLVHPEFVEHYPQSGEFIKGRANVRATIENYPGGIGEIVGDPVYHGRDEEWALTPNYQVVRITDAGVTGSAVLKIRYSDGSEWWMVTLFEVMDDLLYRQTSFFAEPFEAPEWRAQWVERDNG